MRLIDFKANAYDWLLIDIRGKRFEQINLIELCRQFDCRVCSRDGEVMVIEVGACSSAVDDLLLWRSGTAASAEPTFIRREPNFCRI